MATCVKQSEVFSLSLSGRVNGSHDGMIDRTSRSHSLDG